MATVPQAIGAPVAIRLLRAFWFDAICLAAALGVFAFHPGGAWVEEAYANGFYANLQHVVTPLTNRLPFAVCDALLIVVAIVLPVWFGVQIGRARGERRRKTAAVAVHALAVAALLYAWFYVFWGWNYSRPSVATRIDYDPARITPAAVHALALHVADQLNATVAAAHAAHADGSDALAMGAPLQASYEDVVHSLGDRFDPVPTVPKVSLANPYMSAVGITGFIDPYGLETVLNVDLLWTERPFTQAHEWGHLGAFASESEANFIGVLTTLHAANPALRYSGWIGLYEYLPPSSIRGVKLSPAVIADFEAIRARIMKKLSLPAYHFQWRAYDRYLKSNHVQAGVENYDQLIDLWVGTRFGPNGLPLPRPATP